MKKLFFILFFPITFLFSEVDTDALVLLEQEGVIENAVDVISGTFFKSTDDLIVGR